MSASIGTYGKLGIDSSTPSVTTKRYNYVDESCIMEQEVIDGNGIRGIRDRAGELVRDGNISIGGPINLIPTSLELSQLLDWITGGTPTGSPTVTYPLADTTTGRYVVIDRVTKVYTYDGCKIDMARFSANVGSPLELSLNVVGKTQTVGAAGSFPGTAVLDLTTQPFIFSDLAMTVGGTTYKGGNIEITVNNFLDKNRFLNSTTLSEVNELDRAIGFRTSVPAGDAYAIESAMGAAGLAVVATFTNGSAVLTFTLPRVVFPKHSPSTPGRREIFLELSGNAYRTGTTASMTITLNPGP